MKRHFRLLAVMGVVALALILIFRFGLGPNIIKEWSYSEKWLLPIIVAAAVVDSINPCAVSILLLTVAFLFSLGKMRSGILKTGASFIAGIFIVYGLIGLGILQTLQIFNIPHFAAKIGASLLIFFGAINLMNEFLCAFPIKLKIPQTAHLRMARLMEKGSVPAAFLLGTFVGLFEFPCTGGPYLMVLGLLHDQVTYLSGLAYLLLYNLIFVLPLVIILLIASESGLLEKVQQWRKENARQMKLWTSLAMVALGVIIFLL